MTAETPPLPNGADPGVPPVIIRGGLAVAMLDPERREQLRRMVEETTVSYRAIGDRLGLPEGSLSRYAKQQGWTRPEGAPKASQRRDGTVPSRRRLADSMADAEAVKGRLIRAVDRQIAKIETRVRKKGATVDEKEARTLGTLAKTLETLIALDRDAGAKPEQPEPLDREELRAALARRIAIWAEQGSQSA